MGYNVNLTDSTVVLEAKNQDEILHRWKDLNKQENNHLKHGGSWSGGRQTQWHFSWMPHDYDQTVESVEEVLELLGFEFSQEDNGDIAVVNYDSKTGNEDLFFKTISDLIKPGSTMMWHGEDGANFAWYFDGKEMLEMDLKEALKKAVKQMAESEKATKEVVATPEQTKKANTHRYKSML